MTKVQEVLAFIDSFEGLNLYYPEIYTALGIHGTAFSRIMQRQDVVTALEAKGHRIVDSRPKYIRRNYQLRKNLQALVAPVECSPSVPE